MLASLIFVVALQAAPAPSVFEYIYCVSDAAERLDASGEPVATVVDAASAQCRHLDRAPQPGSVIASLPIEKQQELMAEFRAMVATRMTNRLVGVRACRNTSGCDIATVPPAFENLPPRNH